MACFVLQLGRIYFFPNGGRVFFFGDGRFDIWRRCYDCYIALALPILLPDVSTAVGKLFFMAFCLATIPADRRFGHGRWGSR